MPKLRSKQNRKRFVVDARDLGAGEPTFATKQEALAYIEKATHDSYNGVFVDPSKSLQFGFCCDRYIDRQEERWRDKMIGKGEFDNRVRSCDYLKELDWNGKKFSDVKLSDIRLGLLRDVILKQMQKDFSKKTCKNILTHLKGVFREAKFQDYIRENPASELTIEDVKNSYDVLHTTKYEDITNLTHENIAKLLAHADDKYYLIIKTCAMTGLRSSEQVALTWDQITFGDNEDAGRLFVDKAYKRAERVVGKPKTDAGIRTISLPADLRKELMEHKLSQSPEEAKNNLVFPTTWKTNKKQHSDLLEGNLADYGNWRKRGLYPTCDRAGIPRISFRLLRHYFASILIFDLDASEAQITEEMGHTDISFTKKQYATWIARRKRDEDMAAKKGKAFNHLANVRRL